MRQIKIIVTGKTGVGKTTLAGWLQSILMMAGFKRVELLEEAEPMRTEGRGQVLDELRNGQIEISTMAVNSGSPRALGELWLVHDRGNKGSKSIAEQYQCFDTLLDAVNHAKSVGGFDDPIALAMGFNRKVGIANVYQCGDVHTIVTRLR